MFITREVDYAVRIIRELNQAGRERAEDICRNERLPRQFSYKILKKLAKRGLVTIYRGSGGGCELARKPGAMTLYDVISAVDEEPLLSGCLGHGFACPMNGPERGPCGVHAELRRIQGLLMEHLREKSLADIF